MVHILSMNIPQTVSQTPTDAENTTNMILLLEWILRWLQTELTPKLVIMPDPLFL